MRKVKYVNIFRKEKTQIGIMYDKHYYETRKELWLKEMPSGVITALKLLNPKPGEKILDIGCGLGRISAAISEHDADVTGIDISAYAIQQAKKIYIFKKNLRFFCMDALKMDYINIFDKAICYHVLEHISSPDGATLLRKIFNALKINGVLILGIPINDRIFFKRYVAYITKYVAPHLVDKILDPTHEVSFSLTEVKILLTSIGFKITDIEKYSYSGMKLPQKFYHIPKVGDMLISCANFYCVKDDK